MASELRKNKSLSLFKAQFSLIYFKTSEDGHLQGEKRVLPVETDTETSDVLASDFRLV
jgi:hypothetical protein